MSLEILLAEKNDVQDIAKLSYEVGKMHDEALGFYFKPTSEDEHFRIIEDMLSKDAYYILKAVKDGKICGFLCLLIPEKPRNGFVYTKMGIILNMGVHEAYRYQGIGTALLQKAEEYLKSQQIYAIELDVYAFNTGAEKLYRKMGFGVLEHHMFKNLDD